MTLEILGWSLFEVDVAITDLVLWGEATLFAYWLSRGSVGAATMRKFFVSLFSFLAISSFMGAVFHLFFPAKATTPAGFAVWMVVVGAIAGVSAMAWYITLFAWGGRQLYRRGRLVVVLYVVVFLYAVAFINYEFTTVILFYAPPLAVLAITALYKAARYRIPAWGGVLAGIFVSFVAAGVQAARVVLHPVYFDHNALYHLIQAVALVILFFSFRSLLRQRSLLGEGVR